MANENFFLYLCLTPEALVASQLEPDKFGTYLATGTQKRSRGEAIYFEIDPTGLDQNIDLADAHKRCFPHPNGKLKHSVYLSIYRVLEHIPLESFRGLYLTTRDGRTLPLELSSATPPELPGKYHLFQELAPVHPLIATTLNPSDFLHFMTDTARPVHVPKLCFVDMNLENLADDPMTARVKDLPYENIEHIRFCIAQLSAQADQAGKHTKTVNRMAPLTLPYRTIRSGFYVGNHHKILYYPFPDHETLDRDFYDWWRSANV